MFPQSLLVQLKEGATNLRASDEAPGNALQLAAAGPLQQQQQQRQQQQQQQQRQQQQQQQQQQQKQQQQKQQQQKQQQQQQQQQPECSQRSVASKQPSGLKGQLGGLQAEARTSPGSP